MTTNKQSAVDSYAALPDAALLRLLFTGGERLPREFALEAISRGERLTPALAEILKNEKNWTADLPRYWAVIHASYLLGAIGGEKAVEPLIAALLYGSKYDNDWVTEELPSIFGQLGPCAVAPLKRLATNPYLDWEPRSGALYGLAALTLRSPEYDGEVFSFIAGIAADAEEDLDTRASAALTLMDFQRAQYKGIILSVAAAAKELGVYDENDVARAFSGDGNIYWYKRDWLEFYSPEKLAMRDRDWKAEGINWEPDDADIFDEDEYSLVSSKAALEYLGANAPLAVITRETISLIRRGLFHGSLKEEYALAMDIYRVIGALFDGPEEHAADKIKPGRTG
ncbi:MAG: DUF1186 domain-containing protein, partial [Elusimicrobiota bacterium]|nr:DUF1186 domain-containing protein [Elusimicrobiota bacterium]